jgi:NAD-specific glutamate dehydrogenase
MLAEVAASGAPRVRLRAGEGGAPAALRLYVAGPPPALSECMPILDNLGLRTLGSDQVAVTPPAAAPLHVLTFLVEARRGGRVEPAAGERLAAAVVAVLAGRAENDVLNRLVLDAGLGWRAVAALRTYAGYAVQVGLAPRPIALGVLAEQAEPARLLFECFAARFAPSGASQPAASIREQFLASLETVQLLRDDLLLRALFDVVEATVRTTFFAPGAERDEIAIKIRSADLTHLPLPRPLYEIYVHGPAVEGIHLRSAKVARGGLRLSDRPEDFRTEVLGLMRTQTVKNAVIVPGGAKGGFVVKGTRDAVTVRRAYEAFVRALLALTDNLVGGEVVHPRGLVIHDEPDPYLVVAADKGTATFSDTANAVAAEQRFWLGDAFASGGSQGYDHKALGITARGAWECVRVHAREIGLDVDVAPLTIAGIGDMGGDVFGNALKRSPNVRLRAAFNHQHVFLDPDPDPARSFAERLRLFAGGLGWGAYDPAVLSPGGAVVPRAAKKVPLSPEAAAMLGLPGGAPVSGERLVQAVLALDVDLLFNGGIGTYVGATGQPDADIHDAVNDPVRVRASALRARIVAEGGNLGFTQPARVEYALGGGRINTDAIDNSAGVDLSDHEVNLKICLGALVEAGALTSEERNRLLQAVSDEVVASVVAHNRSQSLALGLDQLRSRARLMDFRELMTVLERSAHLDRTLEGLPDREALRARRGPLPRPHAARARGGDGVCEARAPRRPSRVEPPRRSARRAPSHGVFPDRRARAIPGGGARPSPPPRDHGDGPRQPARRSAGGDLHPSHWPRHRQHATGGRTRGDDRVGGGGRREARRGHRPWRVVARGRDDVPAGARAGDRAGDEVGARQYGCVATRGEIAESLARDVGRLRPRLPHWLVGAEAEAFHKLLSELEMTGMPTPLARHLATAEWLPGALDVVTVARAARRRPGGRRGRVLRPRAARRLRLALCATRQPRRRGRLGAARGGGARRRRPARPPPADGRRAGGPRRAAGAAACRSAGVAERPSSGLAHQPRRPSGRGAAARSSCRRRRTRATRVMRWRV